MFIFLEMGHWLLLFFFFWGGGDSSSPNPTRIQRVHSQMMEATNKWRMIDMWILLNTQLHHG